jgi:RNA polymerase sigma-70 factor (ECF subfamily)
LSAAVLKRLRKTARLVAIMAIGLACRSAGAPSSRLAAATLRQAQVPPPHPGVAPPGAPEDEASLERLRAGDAAACEELVRSHGPRLLAVARRLLRHEEDARDAVQDAFLSAFRALPGFEGRCRLGTWLHRILVNAALMRLRAAERRPEAPIEELLPEFDATGHHVRPVAEWPESAESLLLRREVRQQVRDCIERLPAAYRSVLLLRDVEGLSTEEAAVALELSPAATKVRLHRARQALRELLAPIVLAERPAGRQPGSSARNARA